MMHRPGQDPNKIVAGGCLLGAGMMFLFGAMTVNTSGGAIVSLGLAVLLGVLAGVVVRQNAMRNLDEIANAERARLERAVLDVAAQHNGHVTPAILTVATPGLSIARAKQILDGFAKSGYCGLEIDGEGRPSYVFGAEGQPVTEKPEPQMSAEEWVESMSDQRAARRDQSESPERRARMASAEEAEEMQRNSNHV